MNTHTGFSRIQDDSRAGTWHAEKDDGGTNIVVRRSTKCKSEPIRAAHPPASRNPSQHPEALFWHSDERIFEFGCYQATQTLQRAPFQQSHFDLTAVSIMLVHRDAAFP
jgi:hypothetical protein